MPLSSMIFSGSALNHRGRPELQRALVVDLARGASVDEAARRLGRSRQTAYALRERAGAEGFAAAWDAAVAFAARVRGLGGGAGSPFGGLGTLLVPRFYRGRLVGYVAREDRRGLMATLGRLDRLHDRIAARGPHALAELRAVAERLAPLLGES